MNTELDSFETRLLDELRAYVADDASHRPTERDRATRHGLRRPLIVIAVAAAAIAVVGALLLPGLGASPAYSVGEGNAGEIRVEINRPEDADGLERALEEHGIPADITYLSNLQTCAPGRYEAVPRRAEGLMASIGERDIAVVIPPGTVRDGETFVLTWSVVPASADVAVEEFGDAPGWPPANSGFAASVEFDVATGPVAPCRPIAAPAR